MLNENENLNRRLEECGVNLSIESDNKTKIIVSLLNKIDILVKGMVKLRDTGGVITYSSAKLTLKEFNENKFPL